MEGEAAIQAWRAQDFVATSPCPPSPPLASRFEVGEMGRAWGRKKKKRGSTTSYSFSLAS